MDTETKTTFGLDIDDVNVLDIGIDMKDQSIHVPTQNNNVIIPDGYVINPFYENTYGGGLHKRDMRDIYSKHNYVLVLCIKEQILIGNWFFDKFITHSNFKNLCDGCILVKASLHMLKNITHAKRAKLLTRQEIVLVKRDGMFDLNETEVVIPLIDFSYTDSNKYIEMFGKYEQNPIDIIKTLSLCKYYGNANSNMMTKPMFEMLSKILGTEFWKYPGDEFNMTYQFMSRKFVYRPTNHMLACANQNQIVGDDKTQQIISQLQNNKKDYLHGITKAKNYPDISDCIRKCPKRRYFIKNPITCDSILTKEDVNCLFEALTTERELYDMFNMFVISKQYCHLVLNNSTILQKMRQLFTKFGAFYRYLLAYPMLAFYVEECIFKCRTIKEHRYVFDINTAHMLPFYPHSPDNIHASPYIPVPLSTNAMNLPYNMWSLSHDIGYRNYGIDTLEGFKRKFNLFTTGTINNNILEGIDWTKFSVSGSVIPACVPTRSHLVDLVKPANATYEQEFMTFFNHYYNQSDVDVLCNEKSLFDFLDRVLDVYKIVEANLIKINGPTAINAINFETIKSGAIIIQNMYLTEKLEEIKDYTGKNDITVEWIIGNINDNSIKEYFYKKYVDYKMEENRRIRKLKGANNPLYEEFMKIMDINSVRMYIVDYKLEKDSITESDHYKAYYMKDIVTRPVPEGGNYMVLKIAESVRVKIIRNPLDKKGLLVRPLELFMSRTDDPFSTVSRFHLPCVRGYYTGNNVYLTPSCVCALMSGINCEYKYFCGSRDPIDIINKYMTRGFGIILTAKEKEDAVKYDNEVPAWKFFGVKTSMRSTIDALFRPKDITSEIFKKLKHEMGIPDDSYNHVDMTYVNTSKDVAEWYKVHTGYNGVDKLINVLDLKAINPNGSVNPLNHWVFDAVYQTMN